MLVLPILLVVFLGLPLFAIAVVAFAATHPAPQHAVRRRPDD